MFVLKRLWRSWKRLLKAGNPGNCNSDISGKKDKLAADGRGLTQMGQKNKIYPRVAADKKTVNFMTKAELDAVSEKIIGAAYKVSNSLGAGFLEKVYENALAHQLIKDGMRIEQQKPIKVYYYNIVVGDYRYSSCANIELFEGDRIEAWAYNQFWEAEG
jgi:hypothetical protein